MVAAAADQSGDTTIARGGYDLCHALLTARGCGETIARQKTAVTDTKRDADCHTNIYAEASSDSTASPNSAALTVISA